MPIDCLPLPTPASPASIASDDDSTPRVHFGPFQSPEKKFASMAARRETLNLDARQTPLRRSPRHSSPVLPILQKPEEEEQLEQARAETNVVALREEKEEGEDSPQPSRPATPEQDHFLYDEPSSVLASRIMRAHDNPSPPPHSSESPSRHNMLFDLFVDPPSPSPPGASSDSGPSTSPQSSLCTTSQPLFQSLPKSPSPLRAMSPFTAIQEVASTSSTQTQVDLISFDSMALLPNSAAPSGSPLESFPLNSDPFEDTSLFRSPPASRICGPPSISAPVSSSALRLVAEFSVPDPGSPDSEEQAVTDQLSVPNDEACMPSPPPPVRLGGFNEISSPVRRSTRPRRSVSRTAELVPIHETNSPRKEVRAEKSLLLPSPGKRRLYRTEPVFFPETTSAKVGTSNASTAALSDDTRDQIRSPNKRQPLHMSKLSHRSMPSLSPGSIAALTTLSMTSTTASTSNSDAPVPSTPQSSRFSKPAGRVIAPPTPVQFTTPNRGNRSHSPIKLQLHPPSLDVIQQSPARRVPVQGTSVCIKSKSPSQKFYVGDARPLGLAAAVDSARKQASTPSNLSLSHSPSRQPSHKRSLSVEPIAPPSIVCEPRRSDSAEPHRVYSSFFKNGPPPLMSSSRLQSQPSGLPFSLASHTIPPSIAEEGKDTGTTVPLKGNPVAKSLLKLSTSKIPRINAKPYARQVATPASRDKASKGEPSHWTKVDFNALPRAPDASKVIHVPSPRKTGSTKLFGTSIAAPVPRKLVDQTTDLKRKRGQGNPSSPSKPSLTQAHSARPIGPHSSPAKKTDTTPSLHESNATPEAAEAVEPESTHSNSTSIETIPSSLADHDDAPSTETTNVRRTTRTRKPVVHNAPLSSARASSSEARPFLRRKHHVSLLPDTGALTGMTATALRALTMSNTNKNQKYLAATLEKQVIRKTGDRPESPVMKAKTVSQKQEDEKVRGRRARAERRARRQGGGDPMVGEMNDSVGEGEDESSEDDDELEVYMKHKRGPGDEQDYVSPQRPLKRLRLNGDEENGGKERKRVKWDRGLSTAVFLDDLQPRANARPQPSVAMKGCLTPAAKSLRLDNLGNLPNAGSPLKLVQENIVVQKFVYDNDAEAQEHIPVIVVKNTRSKAKKSKS